MAVARYFIEDNHPEGHIIPGVPLGDIEDEVWDALPERVQRDADAVGWWRKTKPSTARRVEPEPPAVEGET